nr:unnamed protein product [Digitaria exilis]
MRKPWWAQQQVEAAPQKGPVLLRPQQATSGKQQASSRLEQSTARLEQATSGLRKPVVRQPARLQQTELARPKR